MKIKDICVNKKKTIKEAMKAVDNGALGIAFVIDDSSKFYGIVSDGDIRKAILQGISLDKKVLEITNKNPITATVDWSSEGIKNRLREKGVKKKLPQFGMMRIPVLDEQNKIVDIVFASESKCVSHSQNKDKTIEVKPVQKVLVVGGAGYLGSVLCRRLLHKGYFVRTLDNCTYNGHGLKDLINHSQFEFIKGDMRNIQTLVDAVKGVDAVIHLAAIVGDPASALDPEETIEINYFGTKLLAEICKFSQINRFIFASTCSVYGASEDPQVKITETSKLNPVSLYAEMKVKSETALFEISDENFNPTILRMATLFGLSPRMRFDLVVNILSAKAFFDKEITIFGGNQWRPLAHVQDAADAYIKCLEAPLEQVKGTIFNVGSNNQNYQIIEIGEIIKNVFPDANLMIDEKNVDERNYNVSFDKIKKSLNYDTSITIEEAAKNMKKAFVKGWYKNYHDKEYSNVKYLRMDFEKNSGK